MKVAACKYPVGEPRDFATFAARQEALLREAKQRGAQLAVLPEYLALELAALFEDDAAIGALALEHAGTVVQTVGQHVHPGIAPVDELAVERGVVHRHDADLQPRL